jgi:hypothetical protein
MCVNDAFQWTKKHNVWRNVLSRFPAVAFKEAFTATYTTWSIT